MSVEVKGEDGWGMERRRKVRTPCDNILWFIHLRRTDSPSRQHRARRDDEGHAEEVDS